MKRFIYIFLLTIVAIPVNAQMQTAELHLLHYDYVRKWRFGFTLGGHIFDYSITNSKKSVFIPDLGMTELMAEVSNPGLGFNINGLVDYRIIRNWHLRSGFGICFGQRTIDFYLTNSGEAVHSMQFDSYYLEIPLLLKYSANRHSNFRPYFIAGIAARYNLGGKADQSKGLYFSIKPLEPFYEAGFGFDWFFYYFKLSFEIKYSGGMTNVMTNDTVEDFEGYRDVINRMNSRMVLFSFHFE
jgi:hypothetical protein